VTHAERNKASAMPITQAFRQHVKMPMFPHDDTPRDRKPIHPDASILQGFLTPFRRLAEFARNSRLIRM
jgi:hypothetical protein